MGESISVAKQIEVAKKYGNLSDADIEAVKAGDEEVFGRLTVDLANAIIHLKVDVEDIEAVSALVPARFAVTRAQYEEFL